MRRAKTNEVSVTPLLLYKKFSCVDAAPPVSIRP
jgi:hypothetical protein